MKNKGLKKVNRRRLKQIYPHKKLSIGLSYYVGMTTGLQYVLIAKMNFFGKLITILGAPVFILIEGISSYKDTLLPDIHHEESCTILQENYERLLNKRL